MVDTTFQSKITLVATEWLQDVNNAVYRGIGTGPNGVAPSTPAQVRQNLGISQSTLDTITELEAFSPATATSVSVAGYFAAGDGGGGNYVYDAATPQTDANGGSIIAAAGGVGCWLLYQRGPYSVKQFGVKGDGTTDDTARIQAADAAAAAEGVRLWFVASSTPYIALSAITFNSEVEFQPGAQISLTGGTAFRGGFVAGLHEIFVLPTGQTAFPLIVFLNTRTRSIVPQWWGATGDGTHVDYAAIQAWITSAISSQVVGYLPSGNYWLGTGSVGITFLLNPSPAQGCSFIGAGRGISVLVGNGITTSPVFLVTCTLTPGDNDGFKCVGIGFQGTTTGIVFQMGAENLSDPINEPVLDILVQNFNTSGTARAVEMNYVLNGHFFIVADVASIGVGLVCNQVAFCHFEGSYGGVGATGIHMTNGFNYGNVFVSCDIENIAVCLIIDNATSVNNTFIGGTWSYTTSGVAASAGQRNIIINPSVNPVPPGTVQDFVQNGVGITIKSPGLLTVTTPGLASGTTVTNNTGQTVQCNIWGGTITSVAINGFAYGGIASLSTWILNAGDTIEVSFTAAPQWRWIPIC